MEAESWWGFQTRLYFCQTLTKKWHRLLGTPFWILRHGSLRIHYPLKRFIQQINSAFVSFDIAFLSPNRRGRPGFQWIFPETCIQVAKYHHIFSASLMLLFDVSLKRQSGKNPFFFVITHHIQNVPDVIQNIQKHIVSYLASNKWPCFRYLWKLYDIMGRSLLEQ